MGQASALGTIGFSPRPGVGVGRLLDARVVESVGREAVAVGDGISSDIDPVAPETALGALS
jgi:hypothetical protein